ncbi:hypothetical protein PV327_000088 [Microctonus hyperodae]|uniref:GH16 domain-containing protein n=1 Tax=Microctonus hyperodae TaxID=165561 RepID=A0AA39G5H0_MICHY|nr:hypothetical protein PV327_000088 [Microctonus hyperodae]
MNGVKVMCKNELIFEENFDQITGDEFADEDNYRYLNSSIWKREIKIPLDPDYEFCVYHKLEKSLRVRNGILEIIPSLLEESYGENITYFGRLQLAECSGLLSDECFRKATAYNILPPVISARLITKQSFTFRYGKIEIRAKLPEGDWLYPEMWLQPKYSTYGVGYSSGRVILGMARGNENLIDLRPNTKKEFSSRQLEFGLRTGPIGNVTEEKNGFVFKVNDEVVGRVRQQSQLNKQVNNMAPYDLEFYLLLGVGVGGMRVFPDETRSGYYEKPWKNVGAKAMLRFWQAKDQWLPSWQRGNKYKTSLKVDYVRVWKNPLPTLNLADNTMISKENVTDQKRLSTHITTENVQQELIRHKDNFPEIPPRFYTDDKKKKNAKIIVIKPTIRNNS